MIMPSVGDFGWTISARTCLVVEVTQTLECLLDLGLVPLLSCRGFLVGV